MAQADRSTLLSRTLFRAHLLANIRRYFAESGFIEVCTPLVSAEIIPEEHVTPFTIDLRQGGQGHVPGQNEDCTSPLRGFLQASPEAHLKRLLVALAAEASPSVRPPAIFEVTRSFRAGEFGTSHRPEFTIIEWYRIGDDLATGMDFLDTFCREVMDASPARRTSYQEAFERYAELDPHAASIDDLRNAVVRLGIDFDAALKDKLQASRDELLTILLAKLVEPRLGQDSPEILYHYPASQASLAKVRTIESGVEVAERFELYWRGVELANGFDELTKEAELRERFEMVNLARAARGQSIFPMPEKFLAAIKQGLPPCTGVALGFDRLVMVASGSQSLADVIPFVDELA